MLVNLYLTIIVISHSSLLVWNEMAIEPRRGCGYRQVGGLYLVCRPDAFAPCGRLPVRLDVCPCCGAGVRQTRGWQWIGFDLIAAAFRTPCADGGGCGRCPLGDASRARAVIGERLGLLWVGRRHYPTPDHFVVEARTLGVSKRIPAVPRGFEPGKTYVALAHPEAVVTDDDGLGRKAGGIIALFRPERIELVVRATDAADQAAMARLRRRGITPVVVPDDDPDHGAASARPAIARLFSADPADGDTPEATERVALA